MCLSQFRYPNLKNEKKEVQKNNPLQICITLNRKGLLKVHPRGFEPLTA